MLLFLPVPPSNLCELTRWIRVQCIEFVAIKGPQTIWNMIENDSYVFTFVVETMFLLTYKMRLYMTINDIDVKHVVRLR